MARPSRVRDAVAELVRDTRRHDWSVESVGDALAARGLNADFSSVFRALHQLVEHGVLRQFQLDDGKARFELVGEHHEHVQCARCGAVAGVPGCLVASVVPDVERATGFAVTDHRLLFSGVCASCVAEDARP